MSDFPEITTEQIVARLRMIVAEPESLCKTDFHYIEDAADEIERLRRNTGCARNQRSTQFCAEALDAQRQLEKLRAELRTYTDGTNDEVQREAL